VLACDFFHVDLVGLSRVYVVFVLQGQIRRVRVLGVTRYPERGVGDPAGQALRLETLVSAPERSASRSVTAIASSLTRSMPCSVPKASRSKSRHRSARKRTRTPNAWIRTIRAECTDRMLIVGEQHLRVVLNEYTQHYNTGRAAAASNFAPLTTNLNPFPTHRIMRKRIPGGLISEYEPAA
jgi:putative transposase